MSERKFYMSAFELIKKGLEEAITYEKGELQAKKTKLTITPINIFEPHEIKTIRLNTGLTQLVFARYMGVSVKTVEAWESGKNRPIGSACRLLALTQKDPLFPQKSGFIIQ